MRYISIAITACLIVLMSAAGAQEPVSGTGEPGQNQTDAAAVFAPFMPLSPLVRTALDGAAAWRPDWPLHIPPDSFRLISGKALSIRIRTENEQFTCTWDGSGRFVSFPFPADASLSMAEIHFSENGEIGTISISGKAAIRMEVMQYGEAGPGLIRINRDGEYFFVVLHYWGDSVSETWYDAAGQGKGLAVLSFSPVHEKKVLFSEEYSGAEFSGKIIYHYDSWGNISRIEGINGAFSALYTKDSRPRYVSFESLNQNGTAAAAGNAKDGPPDGHFSYQWDERGLLIAIRGNFGPDIAEKRYEYTLDEQGNWIERREINMIRMGNYLFPQPGGFIQREIMYRTAGENHG